MKKKKASLWRAQFTIGRTKRRRIKILHNQTSVLIPKPLAQRAAVTAPFGVKAAIYRRSVLNCHPKPDTAFWLGLKEGRILMAIHLTANMGVLADIHRLQKPGIGEKRFGNKAHLRGARKS